MQHAGLLQVGNTYVRLEAVQSGQTDQFCLSNMRLSQDSPLRKARDFIQYSTHRISTTSQHSQLNLTSLSISKYHSILIINLIPRPLPRKHILHTLRKLARHLIHPGQMQERQLGAFALRQCPRIRDDIPDLPPICFIRLGHERRKL